MSDIRPTAADIEEEASLAIGCSDGSTYTSSVYGCHNINCRHTKGDSTPVDKMDKAIDYMHSLQKQYGSAALSVAVARLLSLQDRYAAMQADWERMLDKRSEQNDE